MKPGGKLRVAYLDRMRAVAILMVVGIHAWDTFIMPSEVVFSLLGWSGHQLAHTIGRYGVPLFVMLTGALMLGRAYPSMKDFFQAKIPRFVGALVVASTVYALLVKILFGQSFQSIVPKFLNGHSIGGYHLWYMYMLIGLYFSLPFLARLLQTLSESEVRCLICLSLVLVFLPWTLNAGDFGISYFGSYSFVIQAYPAYAVAGHWLHKHRGLQTISIPARWAALVFGLCLTVVIKVAIDYVPGAGVPADGVTWYDSILIFIPSCLLFSLLRDMTAHDYHPSTFVRTLAASSFSIYLWHLAAVHVGAYFSSRTGADPFVMLALTISTGTGLGVALYKALHLSRLNWLVR